MTIIRPLAAAIALLACAGPAIAGSYVEEDKCFGGTVPSTTVGTSVSQSVRGSNGTYMVTAWRQTCETDQEVSALMLRFQVVSGAPSVSASDVTVSQAGLLYRPGMLVKDPNAPLVINWGLIGTFSQVNTIVWQGSGPRFDVNGKLTISFFDTISRSVSMELPAAPHAQASASATVHYGNLTDMWWNPAENGMGMSIIQHGSNQLFIIWYTYNDTGEPLWIVFPGGTWQDAKTFTGALYKARGTAYSRPWDQSAFSIGPSIGSGTLMFSGGDTATFNYTINGVAGTRALTRMRY